MLLSTAKTESFSVQNKPEKKLHKTPALLSSVAATIASLLSYMYFKSPVGSVRFVYALTYFQKCLGLSLQALAISF